VEALKEVNRVGFLGFLKGKITGALSGLFARLKQSGGTTAKIVTLFGTLFECGKVIYAALASGSCEPLFQAVRDLGGALSQMAGEAWDQITDFLKPVGDFLSNLWQKFGAPIVDFLKDFAADTWDFIKGLGQQVWEAIQGLGSLAGLAWDKVKELLGITSGADDGGGLVAWITGKAGEIWDTIKEELKPVIEPIKRVAAHIADLIPIQAILNLREKVNEWVDKATAMADNMDQEGDVAAHQDLLRDIVLPGIKRANATLRGNVTEASHWVTGKVGSLVTGVTEFFASLASNSLLAPFSRAIDWLSSEAAELGNWATQKVVGLFDLVDRALVKLADWLEPVIRMLKKLIDTLVDLIGKLGDFVLGPLMLVPACIRNPIKDFIVTKILSRIPIFAQLLAMPDIWAKAQKTFRIIIVKVFQDGDLLGAAWTFFKAILELFNVPPKLATDLIRNAANAIKFILADPIGFLINLIKAATQGLRQFIENIWKHLLKGLADWLFGQLKDVQITVPSEFSLAGVFNVVAQILGLTKEHILSLIEKKKGKVVAERVRKALAVGEFVVRWLGVLIEKGPQGFWQEIKDNLSDLWDTVLDKVRDYVIEKIVQKATVWLLGFLDISGITPAINTIIAVYNAVESFFEYLKEILEILNSVFGGIVDIAKGVIDRAANFVENAAVRVLPIAIGFLANQLGLGKLGHKIKEIVKGIRLKIDGAIEKLIDAAGAIWESIKETARGAVASILEWWHARENFTTETGEPHAIYIDGDAASARVVVATTPAPLDEAIGRIQNGADKAKAAQYRDRINAAIAKLTKLKGMPVGTRPSPADPNYSRAREQNAEIRANFRALTPILALSLASDIPMKDLPPPKMDLKKSGGEAKAGVAEIDELSPNREPGTIPSTSPLGWRELVETRLTTESPNYKRLHLINENFGGKGDENLNLVPGPTLYNNLHRRGVENHIKELVGPTPRLTHKRYKNVVWMRAKVEYHSASAKSQWSQTVQDTGVKAEHYARNIDVTWGLHQQQGSGASGTWQKLGGIGSYRLGPIDLPPFRAADRPALVRALSGS
jgi:phage-related protein